MGILNTDSIRQRVPSKSEHRKQKAFEQLTDGEKLQVHFQEEQSHGFIDRLDARLPKKTITALVAAIRDRLAEIYPIKYHRTHDPMDHIH